MAVVRRMTMADSQPVRDLVAKFGHGRVATMMGLSQPTITDICKADQCRATFAYLAKRILEDEKRSKEPGKKLTMLIGIETPEQKTVFFALAKSMNMKCVLWDLDNLSGGFNG